MKVKDLMTRSICCVSPDMTLENAAKLMSDADVGAVPVCGSDGLVGIVTDRDIVTRAISKGYAFDTPVEKIMTRDVVSVGADYDIADAVKIMGGRQIRRLPVLSGREIVGILSVGDLARCGKLDAEVAEAESGIAEEL